MIAQRRNLYYIVCGSRSKVKGKIGNSWLLVDGIYIAKNKRLLL
jgi:hypothetical protein